jgi:hypothetical protein
MVLNMTGVVRATVKFMSQLERSEVCQLHHTDHSLDSRRDGHSLGSHVEREDLSRDDPSEGTPCDGEGGNVEVD